MMRKLLQCRRPSGLDVMCIMVVDVVFSQQDVQLLEEVSQSDEVKEWQWYSVALQCWPGRKWGNSGKHGVLDWSQYSFSSIEGSLESSMCCHDTCMPQLEQPVQWRRTAFKMF